ncbi:GFA family protein [Phenylobacterium sp.]|uniref:GFA family protein n=1 Tax=Phenylobacterium sp. TaxID=1871053 RepID=UPI002726DD03|nr:GFA family protein [Phenylobacterium sp.]MDO8378841.1 GFA family protein [Phenylobacterium sp.]
MSRLPSFPIQGGCACGAIRYELRAPPIAVYTCHCADCQTLTASAFSMAMPVLRKDFQITQGEPATWLRKAKSGTVIPQRFCPDCGTRVFTEPPGGPHSLIIRPGTLDDTSWLHPVSAFWVSSAQPWVTFDDDVLLYETQPTDFAPVMKAWKAWVNTP